MTLRLAALVEWPDLEQPEPAAGEGELDVGRGRRAVLAHLGNAQADLRGVRLSPIADFTFLKDVTRVAPPAGRRE